jgi:hypothetical protein
MAHTLSRLLWQAIKKSPYVNLSEAQAQCKFEFRNSEIEITNFGENALFNVTWFENNTLSPKLPA